MNQNIEDLEESMQQGINTLLEQARIAFKLPLPKKDSNKIHNGIIQVIDHLSNPNMEEEQCALLILQEIKNTEGILQKNTSTHCKILQWIKTPFSQNTQEKKREKSMIKLAKTQGVNGLKILKQKIRWEASKAKYPMDFAKLTLLEEEIQKQITGETKKFSKI